MADWQERLAPFVYAIEQRLDALKYGWRYARGGPDPLRIATYLGYGNAERLYLMGRVLEDRNIEPPGEQDSTWKNLQDMWKRFASREVPGARLLARFRDVEQEIVADEEGMFEVNLELASPLEEHGRWLPVELELLAPEYRGQEGPLRSEGHVLVPPRTAKFGLISDIDDTVVQTHATDLLKAARMVLLGSARTRLPFPGVASLYRALYAGLPDELGNPLFYVSNGPWNLYDVLVEFLKLQEIPPGPLFLRNWGVYEDEILPTDQRGHKLELIRPILDTYPDLPFILFGDSGEADAEIYHQVVHDYPDRILAVYIRNILPDSDPSLLNALAEEVVAAGSTMILAKDSLIMAEHALQQGWIAEENVAAIQAEVAGLEPALG